MTQVEKICNFCSKTFSLHLKVYNRAIKRKQVNFFCSRKCTNLARRVKIITKICPLCNTNFSLLNYRQSKTFCSKQCAYKYSISFVDNQKRIRNSILSRRKKIKYKTCSICNKTFFGKTKCCSILCANTGRLNGSRIGGRISANIQKSIRRSKNEALFYDLCKSRFINILSNERIFNGWDADIVLPDEKIAVLWNGNWHYKKITHKHSVEQVQNRDLIKVKEIIKCKYVPYIIQDLGKFNPNFVKQEFDKFIKNINHLKEISLFLNRDTKA